jgi:hypothetical protein
MLLTFWFMKILFRAYFHQKKIQKKLVENFLGSGSGSGSGRFQKLDPDLDPVKNHPDPQHRKEVISEILLEILNMFMINQSRQTLKEITL